MYTFTHLFYTGPTGDIQLIWSPAEASGCSVLAEPQLAIWLALSSLHCAAMAFVWHAVTHSAVPLPAEPIRVCVCVCACACLCVCEGEIYLSSTSSGICGVCSVGKMLSLWLISWYELRSFFPAELRPSPYPNSLPNPDVSAVVWLIFTLWYCAAILSVPTLLNVSYFSR